MSGSMREMQRRRQLKKMQKLNDALELKIKELNNQKIEEKEIVVSEIKNNDDENL